MKTIIYSIAAIAMFVLAGCSNVNEAIDDLEANSACENYCAKKFDCDDTEPNDSEFDSCVASCRDTIEDECGNDDQPAAVDRMESCVDKSCGEFTACMVFDAAPACYGFVN